jgi:hypothetical protein
MMRRLGRSTAVDERLVAVVMFACLATASLGSIVIYRRLPSHHREDETLDVLRMIANIFVVMTSLVLGLMINSAKNTLESVDRNIHALAAQLILLDRSLQHYGADAGAARQGLLAYAQRAARTIYHDDTLIADRETEKLLNAVAASIKALKAQDAEQRALLQSAQQQFLKLVELRWLIVGQSQGTIPPSLVVMVVAWLMLVFASYGCRAPANGLVVASFLAASLLLAGAIYLILDMDRPFTGPVRVSADPLLRAVAEMEQ